MARRFFLIILFLFSSCHKKNQSHFHGLAMGMPYSLRIDDPIASPSKVRAAITSVMEEVDTLYNHWNPDSELSTLNAKQSGSLSKKLYDLLLIVERAVSLTEGYFDPTLGDWPKLHLNDRYIEKGVSKINLDAIVKGYAVDLIAQKLAELGYCNFFVEWAGEIACYGKPRDKEAWQIGIRHPAHPQRYLAQLSLRDKALATSGDAYAQIPTPSGPITHIFNPKTHEWLKIEKGSIASVTIATTSCALADAIATASMLQGADAPQYLARIQKQLPDLEFWIAYHDE